MAVFERGLDYFAFGSRTLLHSVPNFAGTDVKVLQNIYNELQRILTPALGDEIDVDGFFGPETEQAVRRFQTHFGLRVDGIVGPQTYLAFGQAVGTNVTYGGPPFGIRDLGEGISGGDVTVLQNRLNCFRYTTKLGSPATGEFGAGTTAGVVDFQHGSNQKGDAGVPLDGGVSLETFDALFIYTYAGGRNLGQDVKGLDVAWIQYFLAQSTNGGGNLYYGGRIDGIFGPITDAAVKQWQADHVLAPSGIVDQAFYYSIGSNNTEHAPNPAPLPPSPPAIWFPCNSIMWVPGPIPPELSEACAAVMSRILDSGLEAISVMAAGLPAPGFYGDFDLFEVLVETPVAEPYRFRLFAVPDDPSTWAGTLALPPYLTPDTEVGLRPVNSDTNVPGPVLLTGDLYGCKR
ncbi:MAG: peptidoglycan-binding protein [Firmicutes bacterium]|nr:peptidoglycan-binding protein [Bacillota bacterium]